MCQLHRWSQREKYVIPTRRDPNAVPEGIAEMGTSLGYLLVGMTYFSLCAHLCSWHTIELTFFCHHLTLEIEQVGGSMNDQDVY